MLGAPTSGSGGEAAKGPLSHYRADIDGLRAVAVLAVVWFHSGLPGLPGGFVGVDVFFVISGYLITSIIRREAEQGRFSFAHFYERRFRRIAPALVTVIAASTLAALVLLLPYELEQFATSAIAALGMVSNLYFWRTTNYFSFAHAIVPLLHTWSLGVEEQFYLFFPAALLVAERLRKPTPFILIAGVLSFVLCLWATDRTPAAAFYLLPTRGWELMAGAILAQGAVSIPRSVSHFAGLAGIALILAACVLFGSDDPFPGWRAMLPTIGTTLVIASGRQSVSGRVLSWPPLVYVGRVSYSFYLWHWPVFVFLRHWRANLQLPPIWAAGGIALAFLLSVASYRWIEQPSRNHATPFHRVLLACLGVAAAVLIGAGASIAAKGLPQRLRASVVRMAEGHDAYAPLAHRCTSMGFDFAVEHCHIGPPGEPQLLLWGDSHAAAISEGVAVGSQTPGIVISMGACPPIPSWPRGEVPTECRETNARALEFAASSPRIKTVVLNANWRQLEEEPAYWRSEQQVVDRLDAAGKQVLVVAGVPDPGVDAPWASAIRARWGRPLLQLRCSKADVPLRRITLVDVSDGFCREPAFALYSDSSHPSRHAGLTIIAPAVREAMQALR